MYLLYYLTLLSENDVHLVAFVFVKNVIDSGRRKNQPISGHSSRPHQLPVLSANSRNLRLQFVWVTKITQWNSGKTLPGLISCHIPLMESMQLCINQLFCVLFRSFDCCESQKHYILLSLTVICKSNNASSSTLL